MPQDGTPSRRIVYIVPTPDHVCVRHRVDVFIPALQAAGWTVEKWVLPEGPVARLRLFWRARKADMVVIVRKLLRRGQLRFLRWRARRLMFDLDDALIYRDSSRKDQFSRSRAWRFRLIARAADRVIAGNDYLADIVKRFGGRPAVIPTTVDHQRLKPAGEHRAGGKVIIGWIGSGSTLMYLEGLKPVFEAVARHYGSSMALKIICDRFPGPMGLETIEKPWSQADEADELRSLDIGVMPLPDDVWTRGKCGFKLLQYMAAGVPTVASPVGVNTTIIRDGETGFLAADDEAWTAALTRLIEDMHLRRRIGGAGRASLVGRYTVADWTERYVQLIENVAGASGEARE